MKMINLDYNSRSSSSEVEGTHVEKWLNGSKKKIGKSAGVTAELQFRSIIPFRKENDEMSRTHYYDVTYDVSAIRVRLGLENCFLSFSAIFLI